MKLTEHFRLEEFACRNGAEVPARWVDRVRHLAEQLEVIREECGNRPIVITSGYRTPSYNRAVGGARRSQHKVCRAADIKVLGMSPRKVAQVARRLVREGRIDIGGIGDYSTFTHVDTRAKRPARWRAG